MVCKRELSPRSPIVLYLNLLAFTFSFSSQLYGIYLNLLLIKATHSLPHMHPAWNLQCIRSKRDSVRKAREAYLINRAKALH